MVTGAAGNCGTDHEPRAMRATCIDVPRLHTPTDAAGVRNPAYDPMFFVSARAMIVSGAPCSGRAHGAPGVVADSRFKHANAGLGAASHAGAPVAKPV